MESAVGGRDVGVLSEALDDTLVLREERQHPDTGPRGVRSAAAGDTEQEEDFFDCQETMEGHGERTEEDREPSRRECKERRQGVYGGQEPELLRGTGEDTREEEKDQGDHVVREGEEEPDSWVECPEDKQEVLAKDDKEDLELKEEVALEFDDEYLRDLEKDLSQEEKESRKVESLKLKEIGNGQFKKGEHSEAEESYTAALRACPVCYTKERSILFSNRAAARLHMDKKENAIADCTKAIELNPDYIRAILRRAELYEKTDKLDEALEDYQLVMEKDPSVQQAREACMRLPQQIQERNEKLKEEMLGKLKDLGNMFLRPFGLSTNNFQVTQDPNSGSYSINFVQNATNNNNR
ncbi:tetratricopeptide repeat protein 1 [Scleropages formosus]|nr:tetratricopeptide repeat protein 1 [Scleropages formosus]